MQKMDTSDAHESFKRLLNAARKKLQRPDITHREIATMLGVTPQNVTNWATRGVSREGALLAEQHLNVSSTFIRKGITAYPKYEPTPNEVKEDAPIYGSWPFRNVTHTPGNTLIEVILWLCFIVPGLIYSIWRISARKPKCPACESLRVIPPNSPAAVAHRLQLANNK